jgi:hypothetical protein
MLLTRPPKEYEPQACETAGPAGSEPVPANPRLLKPDFLGISAPRTGTHWLRHHLGAHPRVRLIGENLWFYDLCLPYHQFSRYFVPGRVNGDITPMYCLLTQGDVARVHHLLPDCKLVLLLRDPVSRAWSHLKHMERHCEAVFAQGESDYIRAACCPYAIIHGDYLGTLNRWLSVFPRSRVLIRFFEDISRRPDELLEEIFAHIGVVPTAPKSSDLRKPRNEDPAARACPPVLEMFLQQIYRARTEALLNRFRLTPPPEWDRTLRAASTFDLDYWAYHARHIEDVKVEILRKWLP